MAGQPPARGRLLYGMAHDEFRALRIVGFLTLPLVLFVVPLVFQVHLLALKSGQDDTFLWLTSSAILLLSAWFLFRWMIRPEPLEIFMDAIVPTERPLFEKRGRAIPVGEIRTIREAAMNRRPGKERFIITDSRRKEYFVDFAVVGRYVAMPERETARKAFEEFLRVAQEHSIGVSRPRPTGP